MRDDEAVYPHDFADGRVGFAVAVFGVFEHGLQGGLDFLREVREAFEDGVAHGFADGVHFTREQEVEDSGIVEEVGFRRPPRFFVAGEFGQPVGAVQDIGFADEAVGFLPVFVVDGG